jgi:hypothetical protein
MGTAMAGNRYPQWNPSFRMLFLLSLYIPKRLNGRAADLSAPVRSAILTARGLG